MGPFWKIEDAQSEVYSPVQEHSPGMVSVAYKPPTDSTLRLAQEFKEFCTDQASGESAKDLVLYEK